MRNSYCAEVRLDTLMSSTVYAPGWRPTKLNLSESASTTFGSALPYKEGVSDDDCSTDPCRTAGGAVCSPRGTTSERDQIKAATPVSAVMTAAAPVNTPGSVDHHDPVPWRSVLPLSMRVFNLFKRGPARSPPR